MILEIFGKYWIEAICILLSGGFAMLFRWVIAVKRGMQALLRDRIIQAYNHYSGNGFCPIYALENIHSMYKEYHALGGNGAVTHLMEEIETLPCTRTGDHP